MRAISQLRFNSIAGYVRNPHVFLLGVELEWYEVGNEKLLGIIILDVTDKDFGYVILARDRLKRFRAVESIHSFPSRKKARTELRKELAKRVKHKAESFNQGDEKGEPLDFFRPVVKNEKLNRAFLELSTKGVYPANQLIEEMMHWYEDVDGNFLEQFQSTGFDARLWELYLYALFIELGYAFDRTYQAPDFLCVGLQGKFFVEATTVNPTSPPVNLADMTKDEYYEQYVPMKFGSALFSKLKKKYWEKEYVKDLPLVFAIQDFHEFQSMSWSSYALAEYLYGSRTIKSLKEDGTTEDRVEKIESYKLGEKEIPAGFFFQPDAENVSAVIANPGGTIAKFNRIGLLAGFGDTSKMTMFRHGLCFRNSDVIEHFTAEVNSSDYTETWVEGLSVYHNPNAKHRLNPDYLPGAAHFFFTDKGTVTYMPEFHPIGSTTSILHIRNSISQDNSKITETRDFLEQKMDEKFKDGEFIIPIIDEEKN